MWGNAQGWFLSMVLVGALLFGMHKLNDIGLISEPTPFGRDEANLAAVALPTSPSAVVVVNESVDATKLYRAAIDDYLAKADDYEKFIKSKEAAYAQKLQGLKNLLDATHGKAAIFADTPAQLVTYQPKPELEALGAMGHLAARAALLYQSDDPAEATKYFEAEFALGAKLYDERITVDEFSLGLELMSEASAGLTRLYQKSDQSGKSAAFREFDAGRMNYYNQRVLPMLKVLQSIDTNVVGEHAGDIFYFARASKERMYRVEAIFAMGRMRFFAGQDGRVGDQRGAMKELKRLTEHSDPIIRRAAIEARDLTIEQYRMLK